MYSKDQFTEEINFMTSYYLLLSLFILPLLLFLKSKLIKALSLKKNYKLPPGPWSLPIIGSIQHLIGKGLPHHALCDLSRQYGGLMFLQVGELPIVVVSSREAAREIFKTHDLQFCDRPMSPAYKALTYDGKGFALAPYGDYWRDIRKICMMEMFTSKHVQSFRCIREEEVMNLIKHISTVSGRRQFLNLSHLLPSVVNDVILRAIMGSKSKDQDLLLREIQNVFEITTEFNIANMFPSSHLAKMLSSAVNRAEKCRRDVDRLFESVIREHRLTNERGGESKDLLSALLKLYDEGSHNTLNSLDSIKAIIFDVIAAGTETSATVLDWAMAELMKNPEIMKKAQTEIRRKLHGRENLIEPDLNDLELIHQIIKETMRMHPPAPLLGPRRCRETCNILGYDIPNGTTVIVNAWDIGKNPNYWRDAEKFKPERFTGVNDNVQSEGEDFRFIPFGGGRRVCPGVLFGTSMVELVVANLLFHFDWELPVGMSPNELDMTETFGATARRKSPLLLHAIPYQHRSYL